MASRTTASTVALGAVCVIHLGCIYYYYYKRAKVSEECKRQLKQREDEAELLALADEVVSRCEQKMAALGDNIAAACRPAPEISHAASLEIASITGGPGGRAELLTELHRSGTFLDTTEVQIRGFEKLPPAAHQESAPVYRSLDSNFGSNDTPPTLERFASSDIKRAVNQVLMPKLLDLQAMRGRARKMVRERKMGRVEMTKQINAAAQAFDARYAEALRAATALVQELPEDATEIPLRRLASSEESWDMAVELNNRVAELAPQDD